MALKQTKGKDMKQRQYRLGLCALALAAGLLPLAAQGGDVWLSAGPVWRGGMDVKFSGSSYAQTLGLNTDVGVGIGAASAYADRTYDDGYVNKDSSLGGGIVPNTTWNWGYNTPGQYNAAAPQTLTFQKQGIPRYSSFTDGGAGGKDDMLGAGLRLQAGFPVKKGDKWSVDLVLGFQGIWGAEGKFRENAGLVDVIDTYDVSGIAPFPGAGHSGTYGGPFDPAATPPYTIIPNLPVSRAPPAPSAVAPAVQSRIAFDVDQSLYQLSVGPQIGLKAGKRLQFVTTPTISLIILDVDVQRSETFFYGGALSQWSDRAGQREVNLGLGITGGANLNLGKGWFTGVFGGFEWVMENMDFTVGPNRVSVDASGWTAGLAFGKSF